MRDEHLSIGLHSGEESRAIQLDRSSLPRGESRISSLIPKFPNTYTDIHLGLVEKELVRDARGEGDEKFEGAPRCKKVLDEKRGKCGLIGTNDKVRADTKEDGEAFFVARSTMKTRKTCRTAATCYLVQDDIARGQSKMGK